jgi:hypothetical protein
MRKPSKRCENCANHKPDPQFIHIQCGITGKSHAPDYRCGLYVRQHTKGGGR